MVLSILLGTVLLLTGIILVAFLFSLRAYF